MSTTSAEAYYRAVGDNDLPTMEKYLHLYNGTLPCEAILTAKEILF